MNSIWSGSINFGLVNIPIKLYTAVTEAHLHFKFLRRKDLSPIGYAKIAQKTGETVKKEDIVRGYEYSKGNYVILNDKDFEEADVEKTHIITIEDFVLEKEIDIMYAEKPYYVEPLKQSRPVYALFREALREAKKVGIGRFVLKDREHLVMLKVEGNMILLNFLRYQHEIIDHSELDLPAKTKIPRSQIALALELIDKLSGPFEPGKYKDTYNDKLMKIINAKKKGRKIPVKEFKEHTSGAVDIVSRLKESLAMSNR